jgi:hypothetical protein
LCHSAGSDPTEGGKSRGVQLAKQRSGRSDLNALGVDYIEQLGGRPHIDDQLVMGIDGLQIVDRVFKAFRLPRGLTAGRGFVERVSGTLGLTLTSETTA